MLDVPLNLVAGRMNVEFHRSKLTDAEQAIVADGFKTHSDALGAPEFAKTSFNWVAKDQGGLLGVVTADLLWDWLYIDELWVCAEARGQGLGRKLMAQAEQFAADESLAGIWLWTQSWQAEGFYLELGYEEFTRFADFPRGHSRIGLRKKL